MKGVSFDAKINCWVAFFQSGGVRYKKAFSCDKYGKETAEEMAVKQRQKWEDDDILQKERYVRTDSVERNEIIIEMIDEIEMSYSQVSSIVGITPKAVGYIYRKLKKSKKEI
jgi:hypothetical protein